MIQVLLCGIKAVYCTAARNSRGNVLYSLRLTELMGAPDPDSVGLDGTTCLTTGIPGLPENGGASTAIVKWDRAKERKAGIRAAARTVGIAVVLHCVKGKKGSNMVCLSLPCHCEDDSTAHHDIDIFPANRKELGSGSLKSRRVRHGHLSPRGAEPSSPLSLMASISGLLTLARHLPRWSRQSAT